MCTLKNTGQNRTLISPIPWPVVYLGATRSGYPLGQLLLHLFQSVQQELVSHVHFLIGFVPTLGQLALQLSHLHNIQPLSGLQSCLLLLIFLVLMLIKTNHNR